MSKLRRTSRSCRVGAARRRNACFNHPGDEQAAQKRAYFVVNRCLGRHWRDYHRFRSCQNFFRYFKPRRFHRRSACLFNWCGLVFCHKAQNMVAPQVVAIRASDGLTVAGVRYAWAAANSRVNLQAPRLTHSNIDSNSSSVIPGMMTGLSSMVCSAASRLRA